MSTLAARRANLFKGTRIGGSPVVFREPQGASAAPSHDREFLRRRAREYMRSALQALAQAKGVTLVSGQLDDLVQRSGIDGLTTTELAALSPSSSQLHTNAEGAFQKAFTPADIERMKLDQQKAALAGTGTTITDEQLQRGERPGAVSPIDALLRYGSRPGALPGSSSRGAAESIGGIAAVQGYTSISYGGSAFDRAGMNYQTFNSLRSEGFAGQHILHAAQDSKINGFKPDNLRIARAFAILDRDDGARREQRNQQLGTLRNKLENDAEIARLKELRDKATGEERAKLDQAIIARGLEISKETGTRQFLDAAPTAAAREQGRVIEMETIKKVGGVQITLQAKLGDDRALALSDDQLAALKRPDQTEVIAARNQRFAVPSIDTDVALLALTNPKQPSVPDAVAPATTKEAEAPRTGAVPEDTDAALLALAKTKEPTTPDAAAPATTKVAQAPGTEELPAKGAPPQNTKVATPAKPAAGIKPA